MTEPIKRYEVSSDGYTTYKYGYWVKFEDVTTRLQSQTDKISQLEDALIPTAKFGERINDLQDEIAKQTKLYDKLNVVEDQTAEKLTIATASLKAIRGGVDRESSIWMSSNEAIQKIEKS